MVRVIASQWGSRKIRSQHPKPIEPGMSVRAESTRTAAPIVNHQTQQRIDEEISAYRPPTDPLLRILGDVSRIRLNQSIERG